jgi:hypothetical protein
LIELHHPTLEGGRSTWQDLLIRDGRSAIAAQFGLL